MIRRAWVMVWVSAWCATGFAADSAPDVVDVFVKAADALRDGKPAALWLLFDPAIPGYARLRADSVALLHGAEARAEIGIVKDEGDDRSRTVELDWRMEIVQRERFTSTTERNVAVKCRLERRDGNWRIVSFAPMDLFAPVHAGEAWEELVSAAATLTNRPNDSTAVDPAWFLHSVDPAMHGFEKLRDGITGLLRRGEVETSLDLISNEGDDRVRTVELDWAIQVLDVQTHIAVLRKEQHIKVRMVWQGKRWRIAALEPLEFFAL